MNELERLVLQQIGEDIDNPDIFTDDVVGLEPIRDSLNDAIQEIIAVTGSYHETYYIPLRANQGIYRLDISTGDFGWVQNAWLVNQKRRLEQTDFIRLNRFNPRWMESTGTPEEYFQLGNDVIGFYRFPGGEDIVKIDAVIIPKGYNESRDRIKLKDSFKWAAVNYAASEYWASRGDAQSATREFLKYLELIGMQSMHPRSGEGIRQLSSSKEPRVSGGEI